MFHRCLHAPLRHWEYTYFIVRRGWWHSRYMKLNRSPVLGENPVKFQAVCPQNGTAALNGVNPYQRYTRHNNSRSINVWCTCTSLFFSSFFPQFPFTVISINISFVLLFSLRPTAYCWINSPTSHRGSQSMQAPLSPLPLRTVLALQGIFYRENTSGPFFPGRLACIDLSTYHTYE